MFRALVAVSLMALPTAALAQTAAPPPKMAPTEAIQLFRAAGFKLVDRHLENRCGDAVNPRVAFTDLNRDGRPEAHVADVDPRCYAKPGAYYAIMARNDAGHWGRMIAEDAIVSFDTTRTDGWADIEVKPGNGPCPGKRHYRSFGYAIPCMGADATNQAATSAPTPSPGSGYPTDAWKLPASFAALPESDQDAIMRAAGLTRSGKVWKGCEGASEADAKSVEITDLNHDGRPEAIVTDSGMCYGVTGAQLTILKPVPGGWSEMLQVVGILVHPMASKGAGSYPDLMVGGAGMCVGIWRSDGQKYDILRRQIGDGGPKAGQPCPF